MRSRIPHVKTDAIAVCTLSAVAGALLATVSTIVTTSSVLTSPAAILPI
jgi:hypothetical protein